MRAAVETAARISAYFDAYDMVGQADSTAWPKKRCHGAAMTGFATMNPKTNARIEEFGLLAGTLVLRAPYLPIGTATFYSLPCFVTVKPARICEWLKLKRQAGAPTSKAPHSTPIEPSTSVSGDTTMTLA